MEPPAPPVKKKEEEKGGGGGGRKKERKKERRKKKTGCSLVYNWRPIHHKQNWLAAFNTRAKTNPAVSPVLLACGAASADLRPRCDGELLVDELELSCDCLAVQNILQKHTKSSTRDESSEWSRVSGQSGRHRMIQMMKRNLRDP